MLALHCFGQQVGQIAAQIDPGFIMSLGWEVNPLGDKHLVRGGAVGVHHGAVLNGFLPVPYLSGDASVLGRSDPASALTVGGEPLMVVTRGGVFGHAGKRCYRRDLLTAEVLDLAQMLLGPLQEELGLLLMVGR